jgi:hypothetical protein
VRLASGVITATQSGYVSNNHFAGLTPNNNVLDNGTAKTIVKSINTHMANLSVTVLLQSTASNNANTAIFNTSMKHVAANEAQRNKKHNRMMQQFAMNALFAGQPQASQPDGPRPRHNATSSHKPS